MTVSADGFKPNSPVTIELHSTPVVKTTLPFTGTNTELLAAVGLMAVLLGGVALRGGRRRRSEADHSRLYFLCWLDREG